MVGGTEPVANTYDALYRVKTLVDGNSNVTSYSYDNVGNLSQVSYPGGDIVQFPYHDPEGRVLERIDGRGIVTDYAYGETGGALTDVQYPANSARDVHFNYDGYGRFTQRTDGTGTEDYTYNDLDQLLTRTTTYNGLSPQTISYSYHANSSRATMTTPAGTFSYAYDAEGRPASITNPFSETTSWSYENNNWLQSQTMANGVVTTNTYNALGQATGVKNALGSTTLSEFNAMTHDGIGNRLSVTASVPTVSALSGTTTYGYDSKNQLTVESSTRNSGYSHSFAYDSAGNPTTFRGVGKSYNSKNQLTGGTSYVYDGNGNPTTYAGNTLNFDEENKAVAFGSAMAADYSAEGLRAWKQDSSSTRTYFLYDGITPVIELDSSNNVSAINTFGSIGLVSRRTVSTGTSVFYTFDERGNTVQRLSSTGGVLTSHISDAFGANVSSSVTNDPYDGYGAQLGYYTDHETGLILCTFRYFDPANGRWITRDSIGYAGGFNLYSYVTNNPVGNTDMVGTNIDHSPTVRPYWDRVTDWWNNHKPWGRPQPQPKPSGGLSGPIIPVPTPAPRPAPGVGGPESWGPGDYPDGSANGWINDGPSSRRCPTPKPAPSTKPTALPKPEPNITIPPPFPPGKPATDSFPLPDYPSDYWLPALGNGLRDFWIDATHPPRGNPSPLVTFPLLRYLWAY